LIKVVQVFSACLLLIYLNKASVAILPYPIFVTSIIDLWNTSIGDLVIHPHFTYILPASTILGVSAAWMIDFFDAITKHQYLLAIFIEIFNFLGEPRDLDCIGGSL